jgi:hypothetical protein
VEKDQPEAGIDHSEVNAKFVKSLVEQFGKERGGQVDGAPCG